MEADNSSATVSGGDASVSSTTANPNLTPPPVVKKKRNLPGMPDPDAEVIALSPKTLMATNRFVCEICNKGFQRDQNLQLHRRGHNLPWKLRQRSNKEQVRKKVYICPVSGCVHHEPSRALGDLTGIKKHFCRKHGEKTWNCDKCSKKYAVQSDWKAHSKICGSKDYRCDCGTLFSRRDSFITHRAFCEALAEENAKNHPQSNKLYPKTPLTRKNPEALQKSPPPPPPPPPTLAPTSPPSVALAPSPAVSVETESDQIVSSSVLLPIQNSPENNTPQAIVEEAPRTVGFDVDSLGLSSDHSNNNNNNNSVYSGLFASSTASHSLYASSTPSPSLFAPSSSIESISLCLSTNPSLYGSTIQDTPHFLTPLPPQPAMSATALLQKAAQMGSTGSGGSLLRGLGIVSTTSSSMELGHNHDVASLGLGLPCSSTDGSGSGLKELMMGNSSVFGPKQTTLDFLGLGRAVGNPGGGGGGGGGGGLSALLTSIGGGSGIDVFGSGEFSSKDIGRRSS